MGCYSAAGDRLEDEAEGGGGGRVGGHRGGIKLTLFGEETLSRMY